MARDRAKAIWITWETMRRSEELSAAFNMPLCKYLSNRSYIVRVILLSIRTSLKLLITRPGVVVVQNPSMILATVACLLRPLLRFRLAVDRHSNFRLDTQGAASLKEKAFHLLSRYTIRKADLTIVTNEFLKKIVESWGGRGFVLQDKIPSLSYAEKIDLGGERNIVFVSSYAEDEPLEEVLVAARRIDPSIVIHITGDSRKLDRTLIDNAPPNVVFTGFLEEKKYQSYLYSCDAALVLTTDDHLLTCGAYEAISLGKPLILSGQDALREFFHTGVIFTKNEAEGIASAIQEAIDERAGHENRISELAVELNASWQTKFSDLQELLGSP